MSISSIPASAPAPVSYYDTSATTPPVKTDTNTSDAGTSEPPAQPPLPPGQGTRVNQLV
jgi:hypothetical protein